MPTKEQIAVVVADARAQAGACPPDTRSEVIVVLYDRAEALETALESIAECMALLVAR